jgi:hypothetical protein
MHQPAARSLGNNRARGEAGAARHCSTSCAAAAAEQTDACVWSPAACSDSAQVAVYRREKGDHDHQVSRPVCSHTVPHREENQAQRRQHNTRTVGSPGPHIKTRRLRSASVSPAAAAQSVLELGLASQLVALRSLRGAISSLHRHDHRPA